jgi:hypothetical protein
MPINRASRVLVLYSNPNDSERLRLDLEHRAVDSVLTELNLEASIITRLHAVTAEDFMSAIRSGDFEIIQFSGHGSSEGIILEKLPSGKEELVDAERLFTILSMPSPRRRALIFLSCFSSASLSTLAKAAPFVITVSGPAGDEACVRFTSSFYRCYLEKESIEEAFSFACSQVEFLGLGKELNAVLSRRALLRGEDKMLYAATVGGDTIYIDISPIEQQLEISSFNRERFLSALGRKLRIHRWIFSQASEGTVLSLGEFFAEFTWQNADDFITCRRLLKLKEGVDSDLCRIWSDLLLGYNEFRSLRYRRSPTPASPQEEPYLKAALKEMQRNLDYYFSGDRADLLIAALPQSFRMSQALALANHRHAEMALCRGDLQQVVVLLECALTSIHDFIDALTDHLTEIV